MIGAYSCIRCVTTWGAVLEVKRIGPILALVADPNAVDAGMYIGIDDIQTMWKISLYKDFSHPQYSNKWWAKNNGIF